MTPEPLNELTARMDALEQRIHGGPLPAGQLVDDKRLQQLLTGAGALQRRSGSAAAPADLMSAVWRVIRSGVDPELQDRQPALRHVALIQLGDRLFHNLETASDLDPRAFAIVRHLLPGVARILVTDAEGLLQADHPTRRFLELLIDVCRGYDRYAGRGAEGLMAGIGEIVQTVAASPLPTADAYQEAQASLDNLLNEYNRATSELARSTILKEQGAMQGNDAKLAVSREILKAVNGKRLPPMLLEFLQKIWGKYLYVTYLRHGMDCNAWHQGIFDIHVLARSLNEWEREEFFQSNANQLTTTLERVKAGIASIHAEETLAKRFLAAMEGLQSHAARGTLPALAQTVLVASEDFPVAPIAEPPDQETLSLIGGLRVGDWYKLPEQGLERRCRLIEKNMHYHYCMFANYSGIKVARFDFSNLAAYIRNGRLNRIEAMPVFDDALANACVQVTELMIPDLETQAAEAERERAEALEQQRQTEETERRQQIERERLQKRARHLEEKLRQQQERNRRAAETRAAAERKKQERAVESILPSIDKMQSGAFMELIEKDGTRVTCQLGLKLKSSGKMIFVDRLGRKVAELVPRELAEKIIDGSAGILNFGVAFEDTLKNLIVDRSGKIYVEEER